MMEKSNMDWVREQMTAAKVKQGVGNSVLKLLEVWDTLTLSETNAKDAIEIFGKLALGHALVEEQIESFEGSWVQVQPGQIKVTDIVKVKKDAFTGDLGKMHNGRIGRVVGVRYGDIIVKTVDKRDPVIDGAHYSPHMLERLVR